MPVVTLDISPGGPLITVFVGASGPRAKALQSAQKPVPAPIGATLLIDTGASCTALDEKIVKQLGLTPTGTMPVHTPSTGAQPTLLSQYDVSLILALQAAPHAHLLRFTTGVIACDFSQQGIDGLLGRDVLSQCLFIYNGQGGRIAIAV